MMNEIFIFQIACFFGFFLLIESQDCSDNSAYKKQCQAFKTRGMCTQKGNTYYEWISKNCRDTCDLCKCENSPDYAAKCDEWKSESLCEADSKYYKFMMKNCYKSCVCDKANAEDSQSCIDSFTYSAHCAKWKPKGYCKTDSQYYSFMTRNCNKTCDFCTNATVTTSVGACKDNSTYAVRCPLWEKSRYCKRTSRFYDFVTKNCNKTCGLCKDVTKNKCEDKAEYAPKCAKWKTGGLCEPGNKYHGFMTKNCFKTCVCGKECQDSGPAKSRCPRYKQAGYCKSDNKFYPSMLKFCKSTCDLCDVVESKCAQGPKGKKRVVNGVEATPNSWPWQAGIQLNSKFHCGGTLIAPSWVLTAAHCVFERSSDTLGIVLGEHSWKVKSGLEQYRKVVQIITFPSYNLLDNVNDIALLKLDKPAKITKQVNFACLPKQTDAETSLGKLCYITGWGQTSHRSGPSDTLQEAPMPVATNKDCERLNIKAGSGLNLHKGMLCAGHADFVKDQSGCRGDSGGPFACRTGLQWTVEGVVSWGSSKCFAFEKYTVFTRISHYRDWIKQHVN